MHEAETQNDSLGKGTALDTKQGVNAPSGSKGKNADTEDEVQALEESEEEGEIGESQVSIRRSARGRMPE